MSPLGVVLLFIVWLGVNIRLFFQLRPDSLYAAVEAKRAYHSHRYRERIDVNEEHAWRRNVLTFQLVLYNLIFGVGLSVWLLI